MSTSGLDVLLTEVGLEPFDDQAMTVLEEMLALVPDEAPAPSDELEAALAGHRPSAVRTGRVVSLSTCAAAGLLSASTVVGLGGIAAAANQLPDGMQRAVSEWSQRHLPFTFPRPIHHAGIPEPGRPSSHGPGSSQGSKSSSVLPAELPPGLSPVPSAGVLRAPLLPLTAGPSAASSPWALGSPGASPSSYASLTPSALPTGPPSDSPSGLPSDSPSDSPSELPSDSPGNSPGAGPSESPTDSPAPSPSPTETASSDPSPSDGATLSDSPSPTPEASNTG